MMRILFERHVFNEFRKLSIDRAQALRDLILRTGVGASGTPDAATWPCTYRHGHTTLIGTFDRAADTLLIDRIILDDPVDRPEDHLPFEAVDHHLAGQHPLQIWRRHRGLSIRALSERSGVSTGMISSIEGWLRKPSPAVLTKLADALAVAPDDLAPALGSLPGGA